MNLSRLGILPIIGLILVTGCAKKEPVRVSQTLMGTVVTISVFDTDKPSDVIQDDINSALDVMRQVDTLMWGNYENSDVRHINELAGQRSATVTEATFQVIMEALKLFDKTDGAFDIRVGPLIDAWGFNTDHPSIPDSAALANAESLLTEGGIFVAGQSIMLGKEGMKLDLSGIAKGYAVDQAVKSLADHGIQSAIVEAGGDLKVLGTRDDKGTKWHIAIRHPRKKDAYWGMVDILSGAVATSGDYENYFEKNGKRYCHILDPRTGYPADKSVSVTILGDNAMRCDALATALFVLGPERGIEVLKANYPTYNALIIYPEADSLKSVMTPGFEEVFQPEDTSL